MYFPFDVLSHSTISTFLIFYVFHSMFCPIWRFVPFNVLSHSAFFPFDIFSSRRFLLFDLLSQSTFFPFDVLSSSAFFCSTFSPIRRFVFRHFVLRLFSTVGVFYFDIFSVNRTFYVVYSFRAVTSPKSALFKRIVL
jgi:hypothetical protein